MEISVIIPHRNSTSTLSRLLDSIPYDDDVEVIVVDNSVIKVCRDDICSKRKYTLIYSDPNKGAGCARNLSHRVNGSFLLMQMTTLVPKPFCLFKSIIHLRTR